MELLKYAPFSIKKSILGVFEIFFFPNKRSARKESITINRILGCNDLSFCNEVYNSMMKLKINRQINFKNYNKKIGKVNLMI